MRQLPLLFLSLLILSSTANAQLQSGRVPFDYPNEPFVEFRFDLDRSMIALAIEDTDLHLVSLFNTLAHLYLRNYKARHFDQILRHHGTNLKAQGWSAFEKSADFHLYTLTQNGVVIGIFVAVKSGEEMYLINLDGRFAPKQVSELLGNLSALGIEIPELHAFGARADAVSSPTVLRMPEGDPIHEVRIQANQEFAEPEFRAVLEEGPNELIAAMATLDSKLPDVQILTIRIDTEGSKRIATIIVAERPDTEGPPTSPMAAAYQITRAQATPTRFRTTGGKPIHEVRIRGNRKVTETEIRTALNDAPGDIEKAIETLKTTLPYFRRVTLQVEGGSTKRVATVVVVEKMLSSDYYFHATPLIKFNRVTGLLPAARLEVGKRRKMGPLWMLYIPNSIRERLTRLSGDIGYGFGYQDFNYRLGGNVIWGEPDISTLGISAQIYRATDVIAPDFLLYPDGFATTWANLWGASELHNYYLNEGVEMSLRWEPVGVTHSFKIIMRTESHQNLQKTTDWHLGNWNSRIKARENPPITPGRLRSVTLRYDLNTRRNSKLGWYNTLFVEHSNSAVGSDFDFTRVQLHLRYAVAKGNNPIRTRLALGAATGELPIQRQFAIGGTGTLNGYAPYAFSGDYGALLNMEFLYRLLNLYPWSVLKETFIVLFLDQGQVWNTSDKPYRFDPKMSIGVGVQSGEDYVFRLNLSKPLEAERGVQLDFLWYYSF